MQSLPVADVLKSISGAFELYKDNWQKFILAYAVILLLGLISSGISLLADLSRDVFCKSNSPLVVLSLCTFPQISSYALDMVFSLIGTVITFAVLLPFYELSKGKQASDWAGHFFPQLFNAVKVILFRFIISLLIFSPVIAWVFLNLGALLALKPSDIGLPLLLGSLSVLILLIILSAIVSFIVSILLSFLEVEVVISRRGVFDAASASIRLVKANFLDVFVFGLVWFAISAVVGIASLFLACTLCLLPVVWLIEPFLLAPVYTLSSLLLWQSLGGEKPAKKAR